MTSSSSLKCQALSMKLADRFCRSAVLSKLLSHPSLVAQWLERLPRKWNILGSIPGLGKPFSPKYDCSLHQEESLKRSWMIGEENT